MPGLLFVEGIPGSGKTTLAAGLADALSASGWPAEHWSEGRTDHPVDFEQVAVLTDEQRAALELRMPQHRELLDGAFVAEGDAWLLRIADHPHLPSELVEALRRFDSYDGDVSPEVHRRVLTESWRRFGSAPLPERVQVWECVLIQNPVCALVARFDQPFDALAEHVRGLVDAVREHRPALIYLDPGDPEDVLRRAAAERSAEWLGAVIEYHTRQGLGLRREWSGFDGYVEFMRHRRQLELALLPQLPLPVLHLSTSGRTAEETLARATAVAEEQLARDAALAGN
ncbi:hypothetical protein [Agrococcus sp. HG114]|uniref:hypothetical protein n=1 Tax=Agrococcus sp. HG114 TaxID=2969757 RepID=UPI00215AA4C9|nr:hypothetical protein [Agrococcus sp. HG114]MCR8671306.1 hypothetical protein [Agrococcus sp. HG114]